MKQVILGLIVICCFSIRPAVAADSESSPLPSHSDLTDLGTLVREVGAKAHKRFVLDPRVPQGIDLRGLDPRELTYEQLLSILYVYGYVVYQENGLEFVVPSANARQLPRPVVAPENLGAGGSELVTTILSVKNINAAQLVPVLRPMMPSWAQLSAVTGTNTLIIFDTSANVKRILQMVKMIEALPRTPPEVLPKNDQSATRPYEPSCTDEQRRVGECHSAAQ